MGIRLPSIIKVNTHVLDSRPLELSFITELHGRRFYKLDDTQCKLAFLNVLSILHFWNKGSDAHQTLQNTLSPLLVLLALNIREQGSDAPLIDVFNQQEFDGDMKTDRKYEVAIQRQKDLSEEIRNATKSIEHFDIIGPAAAWGILRHWLEGPERLHETMESECLRATRRGITKCDYPRGLMAFLTKKLVGINDFKPHEVDVDSIVKSVACYSLNFEEVSDPAVMLKRQIERFTLYFIERGAAAWIHFEKISKGNTERRMALLEALESSNDPQIELGVANLRNFITRTIVSNQGFNLSPYGGIIYCVYHTTMLSYFNDAKGYNKRLIKLLQDVHRVLANKNDQDKSESIEAENVVDRVVLDFQDNCRLKNVSEDEEIEDFYFPVAEEPSAGAAEKEAGEETTKKSKKHKRKNRR